MFHKFFEDKEVDGGEDDNDFALNDGDGDNDDYDLYGNNNMFACINIKNVCMNVWMNELKRSQFVDVCIIVPWKSTSMFLDSLLII